MARAVCTVVCAVVLALPGDVSANGSLTLLPLVQYQMNGAAGLVVGDLNKDGTLDVLTVGNSPSVRLGNEDGSFGPEVDSQEPAPGNDMAPVVADFNGDGRLDLAYLRSAYSGREPLPAALELRLGDGDGRFQPAIERQLPAAGLGLAAADFDRDGVTDLLVATFSSTGTHSGALLFLHGDGTGHFADPVTIFSDDSGVVGVAAVGDLNGDGMLDLAVGRSGVAAPGAGARRLLVLLGHGDGSFGAPQLICEACGPAPSAAADLDADGRLDLLSGPPPLTTLLGNGDGSFRMLPPRGLDPPVYGIAAGDVTHDGKVDLVAGGGLAVAVLAGRGDGTFTRAMSFTGAPSVSECSGVTDVGVGDFNLDGLLDVAAVDSCEGRVSIMLAGRLKPGACANPKVFAFRTPALDRGTTYGDVIRGTFQPDVIYGLAGDDCLYGSGNTWKVVGAPAPLTVAPRTDADRGDVLHGGAGDDRLYGGTGRDKLFGDSGNDRLYGGRGGDTLHGGSGGDLLVGGPGRNHYDSGPGDDRIKARNGIGETVDCGSGRDVVFADRSDRLMGCEVVRFS